jgi:UDP-N-acetylmuramoylalanine--D-glutamate ligase
MDVRGKKVTLVGMGRTAVSLVKLLLREGAEPFVTEANTGPTIEALAKELDALGVPYETGGHSDEAFRNAALVVPSPGVPPSLDPIQRARESGADVISEFEFASTFCRSRTLAVTGTNGKTTTTELLRCLVAACGHEVLLAGNNNTPFSTAVMADPPPPFIVLEISSYQLELVRAFRPWIATVLNVTPDHLARHGTIEGYAAAKARIFENQVQGDSAVINLDDPYTRGMSAPAGATVWQYSLEQKVERGLWLRDGAIYLGELHVADASDTLLPGRHNMQNTLAALTMMYAGGFDWDDTIAGLRTFRGVEHRIEHVTTLGGVDYVNDSKSTNIDSLRVALESFTKPITLIAGGRGKGADYRVLRDLMRGRVAKIVTIGEDAPLLEAAFGDIVPCQRASTMEEAVRISARCTREGGVVLLSPACASFDMFQNFEHRGRGFKECVHRYAEGVTQ